MSGRDFWRQQATWFIDPVSGNDEATGIDAAHAIKTCGERQRRLGRTLVVPQPTTITYLSSPPASDVEIFSRTLIGYNSTLTIAGTRTVVATGTLTGFTGFNRASQQLNVIEDTGLSGGFASHVGQLARVTSGARANSAWIISRNLGGGQAEITTPGTTNPASFGSFSRVPPQVGDPYELVTIPTLTCGEFSFGQGANQYPTTGFGRIIVQDLALDFGNLSTVAFSSGVISDYVKVEMIRCQFGASYFKGGNISLFQCRHTGYALVEGGFTQIKAGQTATHIQVNTGGRASLDFDQLLEGGQITVFRGGYVEVGTACVFRKGGVGVGVNPGSTVICVPSADTVTALWGTGNTQSGVEVSSGGNLVWWTGTGGAKPTVNSGLGLGRELRLGGTDFLWADAPLISGGATAGTFS